MLALMRSERLTRLQQSLQARKDSRPAIGVLSIGRILFLPFIVRDHNLHRFCFRSQFHSHSRHDRSIADAELVFKPLEWLNAQHLTGHVPHRLAILAWPG